MPRIVKDPEERKIELLNGAESLFIEKGYEQTLVSDIVKKLGVAQGTFYYYFKSKDEILSAILERKWEVFAEQINIELNTYCTDPLQKLQMLFRMLFSNEDNHNVQHEYFRIVEDPSILNKFHQQFDEARVKKLMPLISQLVKEGIDQRIFCEMAHREEIIEITFYGINMFIHLNNQSLMDPMLFAEKIKGIEELLEKVLGLKKGSFCFRNE